MIKVSTKSLSKPHIEAAKTVVTLTLGLKIRNGLESSGSFPFLLMGVGKPISKVPLVNQPSHTQIWEGNSNFTIRTLHKQFVRELFGG